MKEKKLIAELDCSDFTDKQVQSIANYSEAVGRNATKIAYNAFADEILKRVTEDEISFDNFPNMKFLSIDILREKITDLLNEEMK